MGFTICVVLLLGKESKELICKNYKALYKFKNHMIFRSFSTVIHTTDPNTTSCQSNIGNLPKMKKTKHYRIEIYPGKKRVKVVIINNRI